MSATLASMATERRREAPPLRVNPYTPVIVGTLLWAVAFAVLLIEHHALAAEGRGWWTWVALTAFLLGFWGLTLTWLHHRTRGGDSVGQSTEAADAAGRPGQTAVHDDRS